MHGHDPRRPNTRPWPVTEGPTSHQQPPQPGATAFQYAVPVVRGNHPSHIEPGLLKQAPAAAGSSSAPVHSSRFQPYPRSYSAHPSHPPRQLFEFTMQDLDRCLYGKQEMRIVQINDQPQKNTAREKNAIQATSKSTSNNGGAVSNTSKEDKNKPAKWCDMCQEIRFGDCPKHGPLLPSLQRPLTTLQGPKSYAVSTFPDEVGLCISTLPLVGYGVFARHDIPMGTWIGPYEGKKISVEEGLKQANQGDGSFLWEIYENYRLVHFLDASDENTSSWMRFIQCARHRGEQNLFVFQYYGSIYYRAFKNISVGAELLVWYDEKYPQHLGIPYGICDLSSYSVDNRCGQAPVEISKFSNLEGAPNPGHSDQHHSTAQLIQGNGKVIHAISGGRDRGGPIPRHVHPPSNHASSSFQSPSAQPPTLSQAPSIMEGRSQHSSIYVTAGKAVPSHPYNTLHGHSPRPGSVNPPVRRDATPATSSSMLRSMSAEDLRRRGPPPHAHERQALEREQLEREHLERHPHSMEQHHAMAQPPSGLVLRQVPPGAPHFPAVGGFARIPPSVMSVTPLSIEHLKGKGTDESKYAHEMKSYYERERMLPPHEHEKLVRAEQERILQVRDRALLERGGGRPGLLSGPPPSERMIYEMQHPPGAAELYNMYRCKLCGQNFPEKHALEKHHCIADASKPYQCGRCELAFHDPHDLQEHMVMHNSDRPFRCGLCARSFQSSSSLKSHMRMHENMNNPSYTPKDHGGGKGVG